MLSWTVLVLLMLAGIAAWFWQDSLAARERANRAAMEACERLSLQFLDGTVAFARLGLTRRPSGWLALRRTYVFDYTANSIERLQGFIVLSGPRIESVGYASAVTAAQPPKPPSISIEPEPTAETQAKVLDLEQWRATHRRPSTPIRDSREDRGDQRH
jgi:hypothetical protein